MRRPSRSSRGEEGYMWAKRSDLQDLHTVVLCLCVLGRVCVRLRRPERFFILQVVLQKRGLIKNVLFTGLWAVLHIYYSVVGLESLPQLDVDLALHVHEHQSASEAYSHHHQLGPKRPFQYACMRKEKEKVHAVSMSHTLEVLISHCNVSICLQSRIKHRGQRQT